MYEHVALYTMSLLKGMMVFLAYLQWWVNGRVGIDEKMASKDISGEEIAEVEMAAVDIAAVEIADEDMIQNELNIWFLNFKKLFWKWLCNLMQ